jgi:alginate O-acetyltransferase complex protein AlgI
MGHIRRGFFPRYCGRNFFAAGAVARLTGAARRGLLIATIACDIGALALFKYYNFIGGNFTAATGWPGAATGARHTAVDLFLYPSCHQLSGRRSQESRSAGELSALPVLSQLFSHVVAGPIVRAWQLVPQLLATRRVRTDLADRRAFLLTGLFLKSVLADMSAERSTRSDGPGRT